MGLTQLHNVSLKVVEELLSKSGTIGQEAARAIADAAMLEVASINVPNMVTLFNPNIHTVTAYLQINTNMHLFRLQRTFMKG